MAGKIPSGAHALVTGARSGLGAAFAAELRALGYKVAGTARVPVALELGIDWLELDLRAGGVEAFLGRNKGYLESVEILVNNAGFGVFAPFEAIPDGVWREQMEVLAEGPARLAQAVLPHMRRRGRGLIVNVSSLAADFPLPFLAPYSAGKAALSQITRSLMLETLGSGVVVIDFQAGDYRTEFNRNIDRPHVTGPRADAVWAAMEGHMAAAPDASRAARDLRRIVMSGRGSGTVRSGGFLQTRLAPLARRIFGDRVMRGLIARYYRLAAK